MERQAMKAITVEEFGEPEVLKVADVEIPQPGADSVLIKVEAAGVNFADTRMRAGSYPGGPAPTFIPGFEIAGTIASGPRQGERVMALCWSGGYAEYAVAQESNVFPIPQGLSSIEAAGFLVNSLTAYYALWMADVKPDERVLIHAAGGGVGTMAVQLAKAMGAEIFATAGSDEKLQKVKALGAEHLINYTTHDFAEEVRRFTGNEGVDIVLETVGGDVFDRSLELLRPLGRMVVYGFAGGDVRSVSAATLLSGNISVHGLYLGALVSDPELLKMAMDELAEYVKRKKLKPVIGEQYALNEAAEAHRALQSRGSYGKLILKV